MTERETLESVIRAQRQRLGSTPTATQLMAYLRGELSPESEEDVREHLAHDGELARQVAALQTLVEPEPLPGEATLTADELAADWEKLRVRLALPAAQDTASAKVIPLATPRPASAVAEPETEAVRVPWMRVAAAVLLGAICGYWLRPWLDPVPKLTADVQVAALHPEHDVFRGPIAPPGVIEPPVAHLAPAADHFLLILHLVDPASAPPFKVELAPADDPAAPALQATTVVRQTDGTWTVLVPKSVLPSGRYRLRLYGTAPDGSSPLLATYLVELDG